MTRELAALAISTPLMAAGLAAAALAPNWPVRLGGAVMVAGGAAALAFATPTIRWCGWGLGALGALVVLAGLLNLI